MVDVFPVSVQAAGTIKVIYVPTLADPTTPTTTELSGASALDATPYFRADAFAIAIAQDRVDDTRLSDVAKRNSLGLSEYTIDALRYIWQPQVAAATAGNKAYDTFKSGVTGYLAIRFGTKTLLSNAAVATGQKIGSVYAVQFGDQLKTIPTGDNAVHTIEQNVTITLTGSDITLA